MFVKCIFGKRFILAKVTADQELILTHSYETVKHFEFHAVTEFIEKL